MSIHRFVLLGAVANLTLVASLPAETSDTRGAFLKLLDRPRVALAAEISAPQVERDDLAKYAFSFAAEAGQRVPGVLVKANRSANNRRPVVIALHGTSGTKESQLPLLADLAHAGFIAVAIDGRYHGARTHTGKGSSEYNDAIVRAFQSATSGGPREYPFYFDTAWDVMRLIDYLLTRDDVDPQRIGLIGFSKGGIETYLAAAVDPRIAVAVPCIGVQSFQWAIEHDEMWRSRVETVQTAFDSSAKIAGVSMPDAAFVREFYDRVAPGLYNDFDGPKMLPLIAPRPLLSINGETDSRTPRGGLAECVDATQKAYKAAGAEDRFVVHIQPKTGHTVTPASLQLARAWLTYWLKP